MAKKGQKMGQQIDWSGPMGTFMRENAGKFTDEQMAELILEVFGRRITVHGLRKQRQRMGLKKKQGRGVCKLENGENYDGLVDNT